MADAFKQCFVRGPMKRNGRLWSKGSNENTKPLT
jgi:hypothetical protein